MKKKRIFWLGMHKLLISTEFKRLQLLGYEVFNPPYLSSTIDQSATLNWTPSPSTLPTEAIAILSKTNFFYNAISPEVAEILNHYFEIAIITIHPTWLENFLKVYHGKIIYRVYGQSYSLSKYMVDNKILDLISDREDFWFCPHHEEALRTEDIWLKRLNTRIIPYCLSDDVMALAGRWRSQDFSQANVTEACHYIGLMCPRILDNSYYNGYYKLIKKYFSDEQFKIFGAQILPVSDSQVVGTLGREVLLKRLSQLSGFIYHFNEPTVCYLLPIEFMTLGGPVIFLKGSLLSRYFSQSAPGEAKNFSALVQLAQQLKNRDNSLIYDILKSQEEIKTLYHPSTVWPLFDKAMTEILSANEAAPAPKLLYSIKTEKSHSNKGNSDEKSYLITFHKFGPNIEVDQNLNYYSAEGIIRVTHLMAKVLIQHNKLIITGYRCDFGKIHGFFTTHINNSVNLKLFILENNPHHIICKKINRKTRIYLKKIGLTKLMKSILLYFKIIPTYENIKQYFNFLFYFTQNIKNASYINATNKDKSIAQVIVPHYYLYPEVTSSIKPVLLYLPDYFPYFYKGSLEMGDHWRWRKIGKKLAKKANIVLTNSEFTRNYLPNSGLKVKKEKINYVPLAYLSKTGDTNNNIDSMRLIKKLPDVFIFYPTRNRPSKRLSDFLEIVSIVNSRLEAKRETRRVYGVLTTEVFSEKKVNNYMINLPTLPDSSLTRVYQLASALVFTSENEGNFPTQINEALYLNTPVIATNIPQITLELGEVSNFLQLVDVGDCEKFADAVLYTIDNREKVLAIQEKVRDYAKKHFSYDQFATQFLAIFEQNFTPSTQEILH